jgi:hypothetical protein
MIDILEEYGAESNLEYEKNCLKGLKTSTYSRENINLLGDLKWAMNYFSVPLANNAFGA